MVKMETMIKNCIVYFDSAKRAETRQAQVVKAVPQIQLGNGLND